MTQNTNNYQVVSQQEFWSYFYARDALLPFFAGGFVLDHEGCKKIEHLAAQKMIATITEDRYLVVVPHPPGKKWERKYPDHIVIGELRLHLTGIVCEGRTCAVFESETVEHLARCLLRHPDWTHAWKEYLSRPVVGAWLRELGLEQL